MKENYRIRAMAARDPRFAKIATRLGYGTRAMTAEPGEPTPDPVEVDNPKAAAAPPDALDHDADGRKGGSKAGKASTRTRGATKAEMASEYERLTGEKPDGRWNKDTLEQELGKARGQ